MSTPRPYADPYVAGAGLGLVLLAAFVLVGRGLGASGAFATTAADALHAVAPAHAAALPAVAERVAETRGDPLRDWLVVELLGAVAGAALSARLAGRARIAVERGPNVSPRARLALAFCGGTVMALGARFARGCTSGLGLTGGATLSVGAWLFVIAAFGAGFAFAPLVRRVWR